MKIRKIVVSTLVFCLIVNILYSFNSNNVKAESNGGLSWEENLINSLIQSGELADKDYTYLGHVEVKETGDSSASRNLVDGNAELNNNEQYAISLLSQNDDDIVEQTIIVPYTYDDSDTLVSMLSYDVVSSPFDQRIFQM